MRLAIMTALMFTVLTAQPREALLIGNHNYQHITDLNDPRANLNRLKHSLEEVDFNVEIKTDLNSENLEYAIEQFRNRLARSRDTIGFLYYTGHGCQVDYQGYLVPTNVDTTKKLEIKYNAYNINQMLETLKGAGNKVNMLFLDACRDVPTGKKGGTKGLGQPLEKPIGTLLVYATEAGKVASDNAKFINALIENIKKPNQQIKDIGDNISRVVANQSSYKQIPEVFSKLLPREMVLKSSSIRPVEPLQSEFAYLPVESVYVPETRRVDSSINSSKWITPSNSICEANEGKIDKYGVCKSTWENAKKICSQSGGKLPSLEDLKQVVVGCGGLLTTRDDKDWDSFLGKNIGNKSYQSCYKQKGFSSNYYWSSTIYTNSSNDAWLVSFNHGDQYYYGKNYRLYVRCVRAGE